jgi:hypothetical protein
VRNHPANSKDQYKGGAREGQIRRRGRLVRSGKLLHPSRTFRSICPATVYRTKRGFARRKRNTVLRCLINSDMLILSMHWCFRSLWAVLTITAKFYTIFLLAGAAYSIHSLGRIVVWLRRNVRNKTVTRELDEMRIKTQSLREFHTMLFLLFGLCASNEVFNVLRGIQNSAVSLSAARFDVFGPVVAFAFFAFAVLLLLHGFRWVVAHRLGVAALRR